MPGRLLIKIFLGTYVDTEMSTSADNSFSVYFEVPYDYSETIKGDLKSGSGIELRLQILMKYACNNQIDLNTSFNSISNIMRDFTQESAFNGINYDVTGYNKYKMTQAIKRELKGKIVIDCEPNANTRHGIGKIINKPHIIRGGIDRTISFDALEKGDVLINVEGDNYKPDVMRELAYDVKQLSDKEFHDKWKHGLKEKTIKSGDGSVDVVKIFKIGGKASKTRERDESIESEKEFKEKWEHAFKYVEKGEKWTPKGFKVYDDVKFKSEDEINGAFDAQQLIRELRYIKPHILSTNDKY
jgi:hypothetical protein